MYTLPKTERFNQNVLSKYQIYNSVFLTLPFDDINNTGVLLPLFAEVCDTGFKKGWNPSQIFGYFSEKYLDNQSEENKIEIMFRFIQYVERQVVLFDAIEDAAFPEVNNLEGKGSLRNTYERADSENSLSELKHFLENFNVRTVLTAHPTQFYPGAVLGIITDLTNAIRQNDLVVIKQLLSQLGKTRFIKTEKPTPFDEAVSLIWYLENVFFETAGTIMHYLQSTIFKGDTINNSILALGFWPGGDRDGNPFVTNEITLKVANRLRSSVLKCYYNDIRILKRKLTFYNVDHLVSEIEAKLYRSVFYSTGELYITLEELKSKLDEIKTIIIKEHQSLYLNELEILINKVSLFGFYFATLDIRQNSKIHEKVYAEIIENDSQKQTSIFPELYHMLSESEKLKVLGTVKADLNPVDFSASTHDVLSSINAIRTIQEKNGEYGCNRYIISNNENAMHVMEALALFKLSGWENPTVDIVPLFEIIDDLKKAHEVMEQLYTDENYDKHLHQRNNKQTIMLGFSDGTKDGGYLMANWSIYKAKQMISAVSRKYGIKVVFFDGRGGPPARGGGKTHKYYASQGPDIENNEIQLTIQGQTISSNFGTLDSCRFNLENLLTAGVSSELFNADKNKLSEQDIQTLDNLSEIGFEKYLEFKRHPKFVPYLEEMSTLKYYAMANIGSRPSKRNNSDQLNFADLRAIPFVGSWSQLKQNVPGFYGVGAALKHYEVTGQWEKVHTLYHSSLFFRTLLENSMMSLAKSFLPLTAYMKEDSEFGAFWSLISEEFNETKRLLLKIAGHKELMENYPDGKASIAAREQIVLPLLVIQQYALLKIKELKKSQKPDEALIATYEKIVTRSLFGNTNASRNSA
ncbi:phosphoenolpyruvate carboxylase [Flavobacterium sp. SM2513]|uniref:phosphoenolpyruvate carboxylase n=1 Tax=Flavobacterium sp. SM2513 TaxID=3424766 RepID=UPI003D7FF6AF